ncbi:formylglycine-generating enzyme family protein [Segetibacter sp.]|uniref:formylglycine-generating enzyme family protein n=1 Tax=Segetibacter sp. TaxID=2231182 RepID=UPI002623D88A|nr:formylglycine-generating enzyme family protein [Segetibacter sp.]MCW3078825.1 formylglycine-rating enzyme family protein [Segetibacter sp.]
MNKIALFVLAECFYFFSSAQNINQDFKPYDQPLPGSALVTKFVAIPAGSFMIGSNSSENGRGADEGPQKKVNVSAFWMGANEVTRDEFDVFYKDETLSQNDDVDAITRPSQQYIDLTWGMGKEGGFPFNSMSQFAALMYCKWLYKKTGIFYRLPTEAEWEYACKAGTNTTYFFGNDASQLGDYGWFETNSEGKYHKTGQKKPNPWGLYDIVGNVSEWTLDHYDEKSFQKLADNATDPVNHNSEMYPKVVKGGGYDSNAKLLRSAARIASDPEWNKRDPQIPQSKWWFTDAPSVGFRIVRPVKQPTTKEADDFFKLYLGI